MGYQRRSPWPCVASVAAVMKGLMYGGPRHNTVCEIPPIYTACFPVSPEHSLSLNGDEWMFPSFPVDIYQHWGARILDWPVYVYGGRR
jgi:hypothetical protein